jgi:hypothetical protein
MENIVYLQTHAALTYLFQINSYNSTNKNYNYKHNPLSNFSLKEMQT